MLGYLFPWMLQINFGNYIENRKTRCQGDLATGKKLFINQRLQLVQPCGKMRAFFTYGRNTDGGKPF